MPSVTRPLEMKSIVAIIFARCEGWRVFPRSTEVPRRSFCVCDISDTKGGQLKMEASTFKLKTPQITGGRSHIPLASTEHMSVGLNYYIPGRKNKLHTHPGEDHIFVVMDGQATFYNKEH